MRIGIWNLDGRWGREHRSFLDPQDCDVWQMTEVRVDVSETNSVSPPRAKALHVNAPLRRAAGN